MWALSQPKPSVPRAERHRYPSSTLSETWTRHRTGGNQTTTRGHGPKAGTCNGRASWSIWGVRHGRTARVLTFRCAEVYPRIAYSREGVVGCALFRGGHGLLAIFREPLPHSVPEVRHVLAAAQKNVQGRALLRLELRICHASAPTLLKW